MPPRTDTIGQTYALACDTSKRVDMNVWTKAKLPSETYFASRARAMTAEASGAAAEVPRCSLVHPPPISVVVCRGANGARRKHWNRRHKSAEGVAVAAAVEKNGTVRCDVQRQGLTGDIPCPRRPNRPSCKRMPRPRRSALHRRATHHRAQRRQWQWCKGCREAGVWGQNASATCFDWVENFLRVLRATFWNLLYSFKELMAVFCEART